MLVAKANILACEFVVQWNLTLRSTSSSCSEHQWVLVCGSVVRTPHWHWYVLHSVLVVGIVGGRSMWLGESLAMVWPDTVRSGMVSARMRMAVKLRCDV